MISDEELARELLQSTGPTPGDHWKYVARRAKELCRATPAERELIEAALAYFPNLTDWNPLMNAAAKVRKERAPRPRYTISGPINKHGDDYWRVHDRREMVSDYGFVVSRCDRKEDAEKIAAALNAAEPKP